MNDDSSRENAPGGRANQAAAWFLRLKADDVTERDLSEWLEWCADRDNLLEFQRIRSTWQSFDRLGPAASELLETLLSERRAAAQRLHEDPAHATPRASVRRVYGSQWRWQSWLRGGTAALITVVALSGIWHAFDTATSKRERGQGVSIERTIIRSSTLPDGSTLTIAPSTEVVIDFSTTERKLTISRGDAYFDVMPDESRPFVVEAGALRVKAVGTAFDVRARANRVTVTVQKGVVDVLRVNDAVTPGRGAWRVGTGQQISYDANEDSARIAAVDPERALSWREGRLEYFSEPLESVVADVSRYSGRSIEIGDPGLNSLTFTGTVFTGSVDDWLDAVELTFPIQVIVTRDDHVFLLRRQSDEPSSSGR